MDISIGKWFNFVDEARREKKQKKGSLVTEQRELNEISPRAATEVMDWFDGDYSKLSFDEMFDGKLRRVISVESEDAIKLYEIVMLLVEKDWELPEDPEWAAISRFPVNTVMQKKRRLGTGEEYEEPIKVADLRLTKSRTLTIPKGPRAGETITKTDETTMSRAILKDKGFPQELKDWWNQKQTYYTKEKQWKQIEQIFLNQGTSKPTGMKVILSRHPLDVLRMSDISNIRSCHSEGSGYFHCAVAESRGHGPVAYLVKPEELERLMSGKALSLSSENTDDKRFRATIVDRLRNAEKFWKNFKNTRDGVGEHQPYKRFFDSNGAFLWEKFAKFFQERYRVEFAQLDFSAEKWFTLPNIKAALLAVVTAGDSAHISAEGEMVENGYAPPVAPYADDSEYAEYERAKKIWDQKQEAHTWMTQYYKKFPKVAKELDVKNTIKKHDRVDAIIDGIQNSSKSAFKSLPTGVRKHLNDEVFIKAAKAAVVGKEWKLGINFSEPVEPEVPESKAVENISDLDDQEIFRDKQRSIEGIGAQARVRLRRFGDHEMATEFAVPERRLYGTSVPGFLQAVTKWAWGEQKEEFVDADGRLMLPEMEDLFRTGGSYEDTKDGTMLNHFFAEGGEGEYYPDVNVEDHDQEDVHQALLEEWSERIEDIVESHNQAAEYSIIYAEVHDGQEFGGGAEEIYVSATATCTFIVPLTGATNVEDAEDGWYLELNGDDTSMPKIPNTHRTDWQQLSDFQDILGAPFAEYEEMEWDVRRAHGKWYLAVVVHTVCRALDDCTNPDDVAYLAEYISREWDENHSEIEERIRRSLVENEYITPSHYDKKAEDEEHKKWAKSLKNFRYYEGEGEMSFSLQNYARTKSYRPTNAMMKMADRWPARQRTPQSTAEVIEVDIVDVLGGHLASQGLRRYVVHTGAANQSLMVELHRLEAEANAYVARQMNFDFGDPKYDKPADSFGVDLAKSAILSTWLVQPTELTDKQATNRTHNGDRFLGYGMEVIIKSADTEEEVEGAFKFVEYLDKNIEKIHIAFETIYQEALEEYREKKKKVEEARGSRERHDGYLATIAGYISRMAGTPPRPEWENGEDPRFNSRLATMLMFYTWDQEAFEHMNKIERATWNDMLQAATVEVPWLSLPGDDNRAPTNFEGNVKSALITAGAGYIARNYRWEGPAYGPHFDRWIEPQGNQPQEDNIGVNDQGQTPVEAAAQAYRNANPESVEEQIMRIDRALNESDNSYDLRIYSVRLLVSIRRDLGGEMMDIQTEIRGIEGVTTVRTVSTNNSIHRQDSAEIEIKFELVGTESRTRYLRRVLIPQIMKIRGLKILQRKPVSRIKEETERGSITEFMDPSDVTTSMPTPANSLEDILSDWSEGGVMGYDTAMDTRDMRYHVMLDVDEIWKYCDKVYRGTKSDFDAKYETFIAQGAPTPVFIALGQNGRIKITGGEEIVWFAKKSGLQELPVFFSYQKQI